MGEVVVGGGAKEREKEGMEKAGGEPGERMVRWEKFLPRMSLRVLLVEADDSTRQIIAALLRKCSYRGRFCYFIYGIIFILRFWGRLSVIYVRLRWLLSPARSWSFLRPISPFFLVVNFLAAADCDFSPKSVLYFFFENCLLFLFYFNGEFTI